MGSPERPPSTEPEPRPRTAEGLFHDLPTIMKRAAGIMKYAVPDEPPAAAQRSCIDGDYYTAAPATRRFPVWPVVPGLLPSWVTALTEPGKLKAPVSRYDLYTRVHGRTEQGYPTVPALEQSLAAILLPKATLFTKRKAVPPSPWDQTTATLTDRIHQCAAQTGAAANNIALIAASISVSAAGDGLPTDVAVAYSKAMSAILAFATMSTMAAARTTAWATMLQRNVWLNMSNLSPQIQRNLLEGPVSPEGLFGPHLQDVTTHLQKASEEADRVRKHTAWGKAAASQGSQRQRGFRGGQRRDTGYDQRRDAKQSRPTASAAAGAPYVPPPHPPRGQGGGERRPAAKGRGETWANPPPEKKRR